MLVWCRYSIFFGLILADCSDTILRIFYNLLVFALARYYAKLYTVLMDYHNDEGLAMILSDTDLAVYLNEGKIVINDMLDFEMQMQPASIDLRLGNEFVVFETTKVACIDPRDPRSVIDATSTIIIGDNQPFILHPGEFVLGTTHEYIKVPDDLIARLEGRSSIGRLGIIVHSTAGFIDPGFEGKITLEIGNVGKLPVALYPKMRCCQVVFETMLSACTLAYGAKRRSKYQNQTGVQTSRIFADFENSPK